MKITAADVLQFDPSKRKLKSPSKPIRPQDLMRPVKITDPEEAKEWGFDEEYQQMTEDMEGLAYMHDSIVASLDELLEKAVLVARTAKEEEAYEEAELMILRINKARQALQGEFDRF